MVSLPIVSIIHCLHPPLESTVNSKRQKSLCVAMRAIHWHLALPSKFTIGVYFSDYLDGEKAVWLILANRRWAERMCATSGQSLSRPAHSLPYSLFLLTQCPTPFKMKAAPLGWVPEWISWAKSPWEPLKKKKKNPIASSRNKPFIWSHGNLVMVCYHVSPGLIWLSLICSLIHPQDLEQSLVYSRGSVFAEWIPLF